MTTPEHITPHLSPSEASSEHVVRFTRDDATRLSESLDTLANIGGAEGARLARAVYETARDFATCIEEFVSLDISETIPGSPWHQKETAAHNAFESSIRAVADAGHALPFDIAALNHTNSNTLAILLSTLHTTVRSRAA